MNCPKCGRKAKGPIEVEAIKDWGYCLSCDHINGEVQQELSTEELFIFQT